MSSIGSVAEVGVKSVLVAFGFSEASHKPPRRTLVVASHFGAKFYLARGHYPGQDAGEGGGAGRRGRPEGRDRP